MSEKESQLFFAVFTFRSKFFMNLQNATEDIRFTILLMWTPKNLTRTIKTYYGSRLSITDLSEDNIGFNGELKPRFVICFEWRQT